MLLQPYNELRFALRLRTTSPLLIKESRFSDEDRKLWSGDRDDVKKRMPNAIPISRASATDIQRAVLHAQPFDAVGKLPFYVPGSSMRGVCRAHLERALRSLDDPTNPHICDPFEELPAAALLSCSTALTARKALVPRKKDEAEIHPYTLSCPACRLFGSTLQASRVNFSDGERYGAEGGLVQREHVRIDRRKGSVGGPPLRFYGLEKTLFDFTITLHNFELAHVVLLGVLLSDLEQGHVTIGSGRNKGYGRVKLESCGISLTYFGLEKPADELRGVAEHADPKWRDWYQKRYQLREAKGVESLPPAPWSDGEAWRWQRTVAYADFRKLWPKLSIGLKDSPTLASRLQVPA